ncbi:hypothetical protein LAZ67_5003795 [Cordylochernes scorpioides]|uniref:Transposase n=1 Tax=Cordylochernes scorpioides TaxID=51811 RepID=A0ABY6KI69_9ARAC|nr:hypothetical protein LAZ67_5003795 [Cordylochernes scorpioides]
MACADSQPLNLSDDRISLLEDNVVPNAKLVIADLQMRDRATYTCVAENLAGNSSTSTLVRVKNKLGALWPFIGICGEVAILCFIIFLYEKKRVNPDYDESDTDQQTDNVVMKSNREFENRAAIIVALRAGRSPKEIVDFLKLPKTTIYRVKKQFDEADSNKEGIATRKKHSRRSDRVRGEEFVKNVKEKIDGNPGKSMRAIAKEMDVGSMTIVRTIHEDLGLKSYALRKGQLLTENMKNNRKGKAAALLNNLKHDSFGMLRFFSDEKNFDVDQKVNPRNDRWICKDPSEIPVVMHTKFPASVMVLGVISSEGDVMPPHFFEKGLRMNADTYINVLETVVKPWMDMVATGRKYVFQQDSAPAHKAKKTQSWLTLNVPSHWGPDIWPPNSPDCNPLDYYVWGVVERDVNKAPHTTIQSVKKAVHTVMTQMDKVIVAKACASFRIRLETVVANNGNYIE